MQIFFGKLGNNIDPSWVGTMRRFLRCAYGRGQLGQLGQEEADGTACDMSIVVGGA